MRKIMFICMALVLALGIGGVGYATWSQTLTITEEVNTGTFCIGVRDVGTNDGGPALGEEYPVGSGIYGTLHPASASEGFEDPGYTKNVAAARSEDGVWKCEHENEQFYHDVTETIVNAYPSYSCNITLEFANCGTVPGIVESVTPSMVEDNDGLFAHVEVTNWEIRDDIGDVWDSGTGLTDLEDSLQGYQLDPCDVMRVELTKHILQWVDANEDGVEDPDEICPQGAYLKMTEDVKWVQWNVMP